MKTPHFFLWALVSLWLAAIGVRAAPGDLDVSFGTGGRVLTPVGGGEDRGHAVARQGDGKIVVGGYSHNGTNKDFCVVRYNADGTLDETFATGGKVTTDFGVTHDEINALAVQADGKIVVAGQALTNGSNLMEIALARYNADGTADLGFGVSGTGRMKPVVGLTNSLSTRANGVALQPDGKIVIVGTALPTTTRYTFALLRYNSDGILDDGFGTGGVVFIDFGTNSYGQDVVVQPDGRIAVSGHQGGKALLARCNADGSLDTSFGGSGKVTTGSSGSYAMISCHGLALQGDGRIVMAGQSYSNDFALMRHNANGTPDSSFSNTTVPGLVNTGVGTAQDLAYDVAVQGDGRIVAAGYSYNADTGFNDFTIVRYQTSGVPDTSFKSTGKVLGGFLGGNAEGRAMVIAPDGSILAAGYARNGANDDFALMRLFGSGSLATTVPLHGSQSNNNTPTISGTATPGFTVNVHIDGSVAGTTVADANGDWSFTLSSPLADGAHSAAATETDGFGSTSPLSNTLSFMVDTAAPAAPVIASPAESTLVNSAWPVISGTAEAGATVTIQINGSAVGTAVTSLAGNWSFTPGTALANGLHTTRATATDGAGNSSGFSSLVSFSTLAALFGGPGNLDISFGNGGKVVTSFGSNDSGGHAVARQSDGKIVVAGWTTNAGNKDFCVVRYNADGTLDTGFGAGGRASSDFGAQDEALGVAVQADGKIIAVGASLITGLNTSSFALARYNADGTPDTGLGITGTGRLKPVIGVASSGTKATGVRIQPDGKFVVVGTSLTANLGYDLGYDVVVLRYNNDGTLDNGFGNGGLALASFNNGDYGQDVQLLPDGRIMVAGTGSQYSVASSLLARFLPDGQLDTSFGGTGGIGLVLPGDGQQAMSASYRFALQADGKVVVAGLSSDDNISLRRYNADGTRDTGFGLNGVVTTPVGTAQDLAYDVKLQADGRIVVAGYSFNANTGFHDYVVVRYQANGALDTSFQSTGKVTTGFVGGNAIGRGMLIAPDGRIIVAGYAHDGSKNNFALARYQGTGSLATTIPVHGTHINNNTPQTGGQATAGYTVTVYIDGGIAGTTTADGAGAWSFTPAAPLADGTHMVAATETDGFGSTSLPSNAVSFTVDTAAPGAPVITAPVEGTLVNTTWPVIGGTAEAGATVTVQIDGATVGTTVAGTGGAWSFTPDNAVAGGLHLVHAFATDRAGNTGPLSNAVNFSTTPALLGGPGTLDSSFGVGGKVITPIGSGEDRAHAIAMQSDGKVVVAGYSHNGTNKDFCVVRYNFDGTLDTSFGTGGKVTTDFGGTNDEANGVAVQADGRIVAVGGALSGSNQKVFAVARYNADGTLDDSFGTSGTGRIKTTIGSTSIETQAYAIIALNNGKLLVAGNALYNSTDYVLARYNVDGSLDGEFGAGGVAVAPLGHNEYARCMVLESSGHALVAGSGYNSGYTYSHVARFDSDGQYVSSFQIGDNSLSQFSGGAALQSDGKVIFAGGPLARFIIAAGSYDFRLSRYTSGGVIDQSFGASGFVTTPIGTAQDHATSVKLQTDGRIVAAGTAYNANTDSYDFAVVRYQTDGALDTGFHSTGKVTLGFPGGSAYGTSMVIAPDGRILVAGYARNGANDDFALIRLFGTDQPPIITTGDATGIVRNGAVLNGTVNPNSLATAAYFEYGTTAGYGSTSSSVNLGNGYLAVPTAITIGGLTDNTLYHYRLVATNAAGTTYGEDATFTTAPNPPLAFTGDAANVSATGATLVGTILPNSRDTTAYFEYGLSTAYGTQTSSQLVPATSTIMDVFEPVTGLVAGATYHFRVVAVNAGSPIPITGADKTFVAQAPAPVVTLGAATPLTTTIVSLSGTVNANGAGTQVFFDYGTDGNTFPNSVVATPAIVTGASVTPVTGSFANLSQGVTYHYRLRAVSAGGTTVSVTAAFKLDLLSGLNQVFPNTPPESEGFLTVNLSPGGILHGWRFVGEHQWRSSGLPVAGLTTSNREIEFRPVPGYVQPEPEPVSILSGEASVYAFEYISGGSTGSGNILVTLKPSSLTAAQWRLLGEGDAQWRNSDTTLNGLPPGNYLIECKPVAGRATPANVNVTVTNGQTASVTITYFLPDAATGTPPAVLSFESITTDTTRPYAHVGQFRSQVGSSSGFVVKPRVVATAAHVVWDDGRYVDNGAGGSTLAAVQGLQWLFQRYRGVHEPAPVIPRGFYTFDGYAAQRIADNSPGDSTPASQHLDVAAVYFSTNAGRGGHGGFLASDLAQNEFLLSSANKMLVGYPMDGISTTSQGRMHATAPFNVVFSAAFGRTFTTTGIRSSGGNSGGPLCVQFEGGAYYPAAIYLGGDDQTVVRAIDSEVVDLFNRAEISSGGGDNNTGGGITHTSISGTTSSTTGSVQVIIEPEAARTAGAGWRLGSSGSYRVSGAVRSSVTPGTYTLELLSVAGFDTPGSPAISVSGGQLTTITYTYAQPMTAQESWRQAHFGTTGNSGDAADDHDYDRDGFTNAEEYAAGTNPVQRGDFFKAENPQRGPGTFSVSTAGKAGRAYILERSVTMAAGTWSTVDTEGPLAADGPVTLTDAASPSGAAFYRIRVTGP